MTRYCLELVQGILKLDHENEYTLLVRPVGEKIAKQFLQETSYKKRDPNKEQIPNSKINNLEIENSLKIAPKGSANAEKLKIENLKIVVLDIPHYSLLEQTKLLAYLNRERFDLVHFIQFNHPVRYKGTFVVTIHDLTLLGHLHREPIHKRIAFGSVMRSAAKNSEKILTISETSKKEIIEYYNVPEEKIAITYLAVDSAYNAQVKSRKEKVESFKEKYHIEGDYFLYTGMWKKHKNLLRMLKAFEKFHLKAESLKLKAPQLVLVGKIDKEEPEVIELIDEINKRMTNDKYQISNKLEPITCNLKPVIATGFVEEEELPIAYAGALAYIIPSLSEGFGLPPLEAMACGTPVLSSNVSAMPEILGKAPLYFDPYNIDDMAEKMSQVSSDESLRADLSAKGIEQAGEYSWAETTEKTLKVYREILAD